jgi:hypothetical protein
VPKVLLLQLSRHYLILDRPGPTSLHKILLTFPHTSLSHTIPTGHKYLIAPLGKHQTIPKKKSLFITNTIMAAQAATRQRRPSTGAPISDLQGPIGPQGISRPKHKRTFTGFGASDIQSVEASIPEPQREAWKKHAIKGFTNADEFEKEVVKHVETTLARSMFNCDETAAYAAASLAFRDRLVMEWNKTQQRQTYRDGKRIYYLSLEFLMGRTLDNAMLNVGLKNVAKGRFHHILGKYILTRSRGSCRLGLPN